MEAQRNRFGDGWRPLLHLQVNIKESTGKEEPGSGENVHRNRHTRRRCRQEGHQHR